MSFRAANVKLHWKHWIEQQLANLQLLWQQSVCQTCWPQHQLVLWVKAHAAFRWFLKFSFGTVLTAADQTKHFMWTFGCQTNCSLFLQRFVVDSKVSFKIRFLAEIFSSAKSMTSPGWACLLPLWTAMCCTASSMLEAVARQSAILADDDCRCPKEGFLNQLQLKPSFLWDTKGSSSVRWFCCRRQMDQLQNGVLLNFWKGGCPFNSSARMSFNFFRFRQIRRICVMENWSAHCCDPPPHVSANVNCLHSLKQKVCNFWVFAAPLLTLLITREAIVMLRLTISSSICQS